MSNARSRKTFIGIAVVVVMAAGISYYARSTTEKPPARVDVATSTAQAEILTRQVTFQARVDGGKLIAISSEMDGTIDKVDISYGMDVESQQPLISFDPTEAEAQIARLTAQIEVDQRWLNDYYPQAAKAARLSLVKLTNETKSKISEAQARVDALERGVSRKIVSLNDLSIGKAALRELSESTELLLAESRVKSALTELTRSERKNDLSAAQSALSMQQKILANNTILAPFRGTITGLSELLIGRAHVPVKRGTYLFTLSDLTSRTVSVIVNQEDLQYFVRNANLDCRVRKARINPHCSVLSAEKKSGDPRYLVRLALSGSPADLVIGESASITVVLERKTVAVAIPISALQAGASGVEVAVESGRGFRPVKVDTGFRSDEKVEITSGLRAGDVVAMGTVSRP